MVSFSVYYGVSLVGDRGLEPLRISPSDFKSLAVTHFANHLSIWSVHEESNLSPPSNFLGTALEELCWEWTHN